MCVCVCVCVRARVCVCVCESIEYIVQEKKLLCQTIREKAFSLTVVSTTQTGLYLLKREDI